MPTNPLNVTLNKSWLAIIIVALLAVTIFAAYNLPNKVRPSNTQITDDKYLVDANNQYDINSIQNPDINSWKVSELEPSSLGVSTDVYWFRIELKGIQSNQPQLLEIDYAMLDEVTVWFIQKGLVLNTYKVGDSLPFAKRPVEHENFLFSVPNTDQPITVFIKVFSQGVMRLPVNLWPSDKYTEFTSQNSIVMGLFFGLMLAMGLSNFFFYVTSRATTFLVYSGYVTFLGLTLCALTGLGYRYLWPDYPWLQQHAVGIFASLTVWLSIIFCDRLLNVNAHSKRLSKALNVTAYLFIVGLLVSLFAPLPVFIQAFLMMLSAAGILVLAVAIWLWFKGVNIARFYTLAWALLFMSGFLVSLDSLNIIEVNTPAHYLLMLGAAIETILLALILAMSHNQQRQALVDTQAELLDKERQAQQAQKGILALQENATEELEHKVQERTFELKVALGELADKNRELEEKNTLDALTGIRNRSYFDKKYQAEVRRSRREQTQLSVVMLDIDHFKKVNDEYGHLVGDECIKTVANTLKKALKRPSDDVCRYGGEEFALVLPSTDLEGATVLVEQLRTEIETTAIQADDVVIHITISAGIGTAIAELNQAEDAILALADKQLYAAKNAGRNNVQGRHLDPIQHQN
jgi:diguanylate cyclase (GGDEF)-like protein